MSTAQPIFPEKKSKTQAAVSRKRKSEADPIGAPPAKKAVSSIYPIWNTLSAATDPIAPPAQKPICNTLSAASPDIEQAERRSQEQLTRQRLEDKIRELHRQLAGQTKTMGAKAKAPNVRKRIDPRILLKGFISKEWKPVENKKKQVRPAYLRITGFLEKPLCTDARTTQFKAFRTLMQGGKNHRSMFEVCKETYMPPNAINTLGVMAEWHAKTIAALEAVKECERGFKDAHLQFCEEAAAAIEEAAEIETSEIETSKIETPVYL